MLTQGNSWEPVAMMYMLIYLILIRCFVEKHDSCKRKILIMIAVLVILLFAFALEMCTYTMFDSSKLVLYVFFLFAVLLGSILTFRRCFYYAYAINKKALLVFGGWFAIVLYVTVFSRIGDCYDTIVTTIFRGVSALIHDHNPKYVIQGIMNLIAFLPGGALLPFVNQQAFNKSLYGLAIGLLATTIVETIQLITHYGIWDINDIITNTLGATLGCKLCLLYLEQKKNKK